MMSVVLLVWKKTHCMTFSRELNHYLAYKAWMTGIGIDWSWWQKKGNRYQLQKISGIPICCFISSFPSHILFYVYLFISIVHFDLFSFISFLFDFSYAPFHLVVHAFAAICLFTLPFFICSPFTPLIFCLLSFVYSLLLYLFHFTFAHSILHLFLLSFFILSFRLIRLVSPVVIFFLVRSFFFVCLSCRLFLLPFVSFCLFFPSLSWLSILVLAVFCQFLGWRVL